MAGSGVQIWVHESATRDDSRYARQAQNVLQFLNLSRSTPFAEDRQDAKRNAEPEWERVISAECLHAQATQSTLPSTESDSQPLHSPLDRLPLEEQPAGPVAALYSTKESTPDYHAPSETLGSGFQPGPSHPAAAAELVIRARPSLPADGTATRYLSEIIEKSQASACFRPAWVHCSMNGDWGFARGHWQLAVPHSWPRGRVDALWQFLEACVSSGRADTATWMERAPGTQQHVKGGNEKQPAPTGQSSNEIWKIHGYRRLCLAHWVLLFVGSSALVYLQPRCLTYHDQKSGRTLVKMAL